MRLRKRNELVSLSARGFFTLGESSHTAKKNSQTKINLHFDWSVLEIIIGGESALDANPLLRIDSTVKMDAFLDSYGYSISNPIEQAELFGLYQESIQFIRRYFLYPQNPDGLKAEIPRKLVELTDVTQLLMIASLEHFESPSQRVHSLWACALLKVMHTMAHMDKDLRASYFADIQKQILDRFYRVVHRDESGGLFLAASSTSTERLPIVAFETKPKKSRDSVILKLLHKSENVAEDIFDRVGLRFITRTKFDALQIVRFLKDHFVIMPPNIKPSRSRNTLFDLGTVKRELLTLEEKKSFVTETDLDQIFSEARVLDKTNPDNRYTSKYYGSIQFTLRQLIKINNPLHDELKTIKSVLKKEALEALSSQDQDRLRPVLERMDLRNIQKEIRFFYPYEVQITDLVSHEQNMSGASSHENYKRNQINAAMRRVLGPLMVRDDLEKTPRG